MLDCSLTVTVGEAVTFRLTVTNASAEPVELTFRDAGRADFVVYTADGEEVWRWSDGRMFAIVEEVWPEPEPGDYTAEAELRTVDVAASARTPFSV